MASTMFLMVVSVVSNDNGGAVANVDDNGGGIGGGNGSGDSYDNDNDSTMMATMVINMATTTTLEFFSLINAFRLTALVPFSITSQNYQRH